MALQMDELRRKSMMSTTKLRSLLQTLPKSLDGFYDRILLEIGPDLKDQALTALQWISFSAHSVTPSELAEALAVHAEGEDLFDPEDRLMDDSGIFEILPAGLATHVLDSKGLDESPPEAPYSVVQLAHFSVKEYLTSDRIMCGPGSFYHLVEMDSHAAIASACLAYITYCSFHDVKPEPMAAHDMSSALGPILTKKPPLLEFAARCWPRHVQILGTQSTDLLDQLLNNFFTRGGLAFLLWQRIVCFRFGLQNRSYVAIVDERSWAESPAELAAGEKDLSMWCDAPLATPLWLGLSHVSRLLLKSEPRASQLSVGDSRGQDPHNLFGYPEVLLVKAAISGDVESLRILIDKGVELDPTIDTPLLHQSEFRTALEAAVATRRYDATRFLIRAGADVNRVTRNPLSGTTTPLHRAIEVQDTEIIQLLLAEGADVNLVQGGEHVLITALWKSDAMVREILNAGTNDTSLRSVVGHLTAFYRQTLDWLGKGSAEHLIEKLETLDTLISEVHGEEVRRSIIVGIKPNCLISNTNNTLQGDIWWQDEDLHGDVNNDHDKEKVEEKVEEEEEGKDEEREEEKDEEKDEEESEGSELQ